MVFHWNLRDNKSPQVSRTLLSILADVYNVVIWIVSTRPLISKSSCPFTKPLVTVPRVPKTITFMFRYFHVPHSFKFPSKIPVLILLFAFFQFYSVVIRDRKVHNPASSLDSLQRFHISIRL